MVFEGHSKCPICDNVLDNSKQYMLIPHMVGNAKDSLFIFSDGGVHISCLDQSPLKEKILHHKEKYLTRLPLIEAKCDIDGKVVENPKKDLISIGLLTSDEEEELFKFNYITLNRVNLSRWSQKDNFVEVAEAFINDGKWEGLGDFNYLEYLLGRIKV